MSGRLQKIIGTIALVSSLGLPALAGEASLFNVTGAVGDLPYGVDFWVALEARHVADVAQTNASAGATLKTPDGWNASLFVSHLSGGSSLLDDSVRVRASTFVNGRLSRPLSKTLRVSFDAFNIFDQGQGGVDYFTASRSAMPGIADNFLFVPGEPRGFRVRLRKTF